MVVVKNGGWQNRQNIDLYYLCKLLAKNVWFSYFLTDLQLPGYILPFLDFLDLSYLDSACYNAVYRQIILLISISANGFVVDFAYLLDFDLVDIGIKVDENDYWTETTKYVLSEDCDKMLYDWISLRRIKLKGLRFTTFLPVLCIQKRI